MADKLKASDSCFVRISLLWNQKDLIGSSPYQKNQMMTYRDKSGFVVWNIHLNNTFFIHLQG